MLQARRKMSETVAYRRRHPVGLGRVAALGRQRVAQGAGRRREERLGVVGAGDRRVAGGGRLANAAPSQQSARNSVQEEVATRPAVAHAAGAHQEKMLGADAGRLDAGAGF